MGSSGEDTDVTWLQQAGVSLAILRGVVLVDVPVVQGEKKSSYQTCHPKIYQHDLGFRQCHRWV